MQTELCGGEMMKGKRGLIMGVANDKSIAWGIAKHLAAQGAEMAFAYQGKALERRVRPLVESLGMEEFLIEADVTDDAAMDAAFSKIGECWGKIDFLVHAIAYAPAEALQGSFVDNTSRESFHMAMDISVYSFVDVCKRAAAMMPDGGAILTLSYLGAERVIPSYNVMGVAKAALEAAVRYAARDLGPQAIRVNAISAGPMRTLAISGIKGGRSLLKSGKKLSLLQEDTRMEGISGCAVYLLSPLGHSIAGEVIHVDAGFHAVGMLEGLDTAGV